MALPQPIPHPLAELIARRFRVIGDPVRIRILSQLRDGEATVGELVDAVGSSQQNISKHLGVLLDSGIVARRKQQNHAFYSIADDTVLRMCEQVCGGLQQQISQLNDIVREVS